MSALFWIGLILVILWALGWIAFQVTGWLIHLLVIIGVIMLIVGLVRRTSTAP